MSVLRKTVKRIVIGLITLLVLTLIFTVWLLNSQSGLRWALNQASNIIQVAEINGKASSLSFSGLNVSLDGTDIKIDSGSLKWAPLDLISREVNVDTLELSGINVKLTTTAQQTNPTAYEPWPGLQLPFDVTVDTLSLKKFKLDSDGNELLSLDDLGAQLKVINNVLSLSQLDVAQENNLFKLNGSIDLSAKSDGVVALNNQAHWIVGDKLIDTEGSINGSWKSIDLKQSTQRPFGSELSLNITDILGDNIAWQGTINTQAHTLLSKENQAIDVGRGQFEISGGFAPSTGLESLNAKVSGGVLSSVNLNNDNIVNHGAKQALTPLEISTNLEFSDNTLRVHKLTLLEQNDKPEISDDLGHVELSGFVRDMNQFISLIGNSNTDQGTTNPEAKLSGNWRKLGFPLDKTAQKIVTSGKLEISGTPHDLSIIANATGTAYDKPLLADIHIRIAERIANIKAFTIKSGDSRIDLDGTIGDQLTLYWDLDSPNLSELLPGSSGDLTSQGLITGDLESPTLNASAKSKGIAYGEIKFEQLDVVAKGSLANNSTPIDVAASLRTVSQGSSELARDVELTVKGSGKQHTIAANSTLFGQSDFSLMANGELSDSGWFGQLNTLRLDDPTYKQWQLAEPINIKSEGAMFTTDNACLMNQSQRICVTANADKTGLVVNGNITELGLANLSPLLSLYDITLLGQLTGDFNYTKKAHQAHSNLGLTLNAQESTFAVEAIEQGQQTFNLNEINIELNQQESITAKGLFVLQNGDRVSADITVDSKIESSDFNHANLRGRIVAQLSDLSEFQAITAPINGLQGSLNANITLGGRISSPTVGMQTQFEKGQFEIPDLGLSLTEIDLSATSVGRQNIEVTGNLVSGDGDLKIDGKLDFATLNEPRFDLNLSGNQLELMNTHEIHIDGNVDTSIIITKDLIELTGVLDLIEADLDFRLPENAILASQDVVLMGSETEQESAQQKIDLTIKLGDKTHINSQGLDAFLTGELQILQEPNEVMRANGQIDVKDGRYTAYNQNLIIDKGELVYNGGTIDDPNLALRAQKEVDEITAGVSVTGRASSPLLQLYSTPSMSDEDILSVLIFGKSISNLDSQDGFTLLKIANSLRGDGTKKSKISSLTESVQDGLGLSHLELQLEGNSPSVEAGKQLSSQFYIGYGYGLLDAVQSLVLRYKINQAWSIQGDVGADSGADLRYQIQR